MDKQIPIRLRFAPSPTGYLHIGSLRTALFNWLFARHAGGTYVVRVEDTDQERSEQKYIDAIQTTLSWARLTSDEPLIYQSQRNSIYAEQVKLLIELGRAYRCYCTQDEVKARHVARGGSVEYMTYDGFCRDKEPDTSATRPYTIRFRCDDQETISFHDLIRGDVSFDMAQFDDFILVRSDGTPTYNFVVVVDDHLMEISHVIRGEDHIVNTPKQYMLYQAFGWRVPLFAHLPLILGPSGNRLSKRDAATAVDDYMTAGYLPDALINYLVRLGWAHGDRELFSRSELIELFSLDDVGKSGARFDQAKLDWINQSYIKNMPAADLAQYIDQWLQPGFYEQFLSWSPTMVHDVMDVFKSRITTVTELIDMVRLVYEGPETYDANSIAQWVTPARIADIEQLSSMCSLMSHVSPESIKSAIKSFAQERNIKLVEVAQPIRIAILGSDEGPGVFDLMTVIGPKCVSERLARLHDYMVSTYNNGDSYGKQ